VYNRANGFRELSGNVAGRRVDYVKSAEYEFLDGRGRWAEMGGLGAAGSVAHRAKAGGVVELIDIYGNERIAFRAGEAGVLTAYDADAAALGKVETASARPGWREFKTLAGARSYVFAPGK
jgi:hypothetical protein